MPLKELALTKAFLDFDKGEGHSFADFKAGYEAGVSSTYYKKV